MKTLIKILTLFIMITQLSCKTTNKFSADYDDLYYSTKKQKQDNNTVNVTNSNKSTVDYNNQKNNEGEVVLNPYYRENKEISNPNSNYDWEMNSDTNELVGEMEDRIVYTGAEEEVYFNPEDYSYQYLQESDETNYDDETSYSDRLDKFHNTDYTGGYYGNSSFSLTNNYYNSYYSPGYQYGYYPWYMNPGYSDPFYYDPYYYNYNSYWLLRSPYYRLSMYPYSYSGLYGSYYAPVYYQNSGVNDNYRTTQHRIDPNRRTRYVQRDIQRNTDPNLKRSTENTQNIIQNRRVSDNRVRTNVNNLIDNNKQNLYINNETIERKRTNNTRINNNGTNTNRIENNNSNDNRIEPNRNNNTRTEPNRNNNTRIENNTRTTNSNNSNVIRSDNSNRTRTNSSENNRSNGSSVNRSSDNSKSSSGTSHSSSSSSNSGNSSSGGGRRK